MPDIQFEEKKIHKAVKEAAKRGDMGSAKVRQGQGGKPAGEGTLGQLSSG